MTFNALYTTLSVGGGPGRAPTPLPDWVTTSDTVTSTLSGETSSLAIVVLEMDRTQLWVGGGPFPVVTLADKPASILVPIGSSDTLSIQWNEDPVNSNQILSQDTVRVSIAELSQSFNAINASDATSVTLSETIGLVQGIVTQQTTSDTTSVTITEVSALSITIATSDTMSVSVTDTSSLSTSSVSITSSDTLSVSVGEASLLGIFSGILQIASSDTLTMTVDDESTVHIIVPTRPMRIRIRALTARIRTLPI